MSKATEKPSTLTGRRRFLRLAASTTAAAALLTVPALSVPASAVPAAAISDPLIALGVTARKADRRCHRSWDARDEAETAAEGRRWFSPCITAGNYECHSPSMVLAASQPNDPAGPSAEEGQALAAELRRRIRAYRRSRIAAGLGPYDQEVKRATKEWQAAMNALAVTPAATVAGLAVKLGVICEDFRDGESDFSARILRSAARDAERLARGGAV